MTEQAPEAPTQAPEDTSRYAAYDKRYLKYVGGVHDTKGKARDAAKAAGVKSGDIRVDEV